MSAAIAHQLKAEAAPALANLGVQRLEAGDRDNAREMFLGALSADLDHVSAWQGLGSLALGPDRYAASIAIGRRALALAPNDYRLKLNLGNALWRAQRFAEAEPLLLAAVEAAPDEPPPHQNIGLLYYSTGRAELAEKHFKLALDMRPDSLALRGDHAHGVLKTGDLARGLELLECRWDGLLPKNPIWQCGLPQWTGQSLDESGVLLLHHEQGFGDTIQFARFIPAIKARAKAAGVIFACPKSLHSLFKGQCGIDDVIDDTDVGELCYAARVAKAHAPLMSATAVLRPRYSPTWIEVDNIIGNMGWAIGNESYLTAPAESALMARLGGADLAIGLCWGASATPERGNQKSVPIEQLVDLGAIPGVRLWSLQFGHHADELRLTAADHLIAQVPKGIGDFAETAAVMNRMDLIVSIDTSAAHLAGALGKTVYMLNPINQCWRWVRGPLPWYGSMTIFDQTDGSDWKRPIQRIARGVAAMVEERRAAREAA